jgi:hypothetical protein
MMPISWPGRLRKSDEKKVVSEDHKSVSLNESQVNRSKITQLGPLSTAPSPTTAISVSSPRAPATQHAVPVVPKASLTASSRISATSTKGKGKRRPRNTVVVSLQMPAALVKVLDEIVEAGAYRSRSDVILQAVRSHPEVSRRLTRLEAKQPPKK